ncbi:hypothetical protein N8T08_008061 [Aspergillus melleus]|uniref:Uncharacterized protein n=1 Tax=Aspergillus melleus TaxID=138277 RepID=A0ACC3AWN0_9EURO|nr:hypothetical protein N8T08_008061 [Aspergillus melleus]
MSTQSWKPQAQKARDILQKSIPAQWLLPSDQLPPATQKYVEDFPRKSGLLNDRELDITNKSAIALVVDMEAGILSAEEVAIAFLKRAVLGHQLLNFATEFMA